jgi:protease-4
MKQFLKFFLASMLGTFVTLIVLFLLFFGMIVSMVSFSSNEEVLVEENTLLTLKLDQQIFERKPGNPFAGFSFTDMQAEESIGLDDILKNIAKAKEDPKIKGILLDLSELMAGAAQVEEIRNALADFKLSGKFVVSYADNLSQKAYYLASIADEIYLQPEGAIDFKGLMVDMAFYKKTLEKLDVEAQIIRHGKFKSAVEPFMLDKMSPENRQQIEQFTGSIWKNMLEGIAKSRKISEIRLNEIADSLLSTTSSGALKSKLIDKLMYRDELIENLKGRLNVDSAGTLNTISIAKYVDAADPVKKKVDRSKRIAVIYAVGEVESGEGEENSIGSKNIPEAIRKARLDEKVKAIVLRVNSPGGSALVSDIVWREIELAKKAKPVIASFGDVAASGGYYIACGANKIFAMPNTITGSIGVFGMIPNAQKLLSEKLGINYDVVKTNANSEYISLNRPLTEYQRSVIQGGVEEVYDVFTGHVAQGRNMKQADVDSIGQGRVWSGIDAKRIGLIDEFGGLDAAIAEAAKMAKIENYKLMILPEPKDPFTEILGTLTGNAGESRLEKELGEYYSHVKTLRNLTKIQGPIARLPYDLTIK